MGIKTVFKVLIGTIAGMIISFALIEYYNISVTSPMIKAIAQTCLTNSCRYFSQESYKDGKGNAEQLQGYAIIDNTGDEAIKSHITPPSLNGVFYVGNSRTVYNKLYTNSTDFSNFCNTYKGKWKALDQIAYGVGNSSGGGLDDAGRESGRYYVRDLVTPLNMGITYLDKATVEKIFRWQLAAVLMNGLPDNLQDGYVKYKGFRIYYDDIKITNIKYRAYDMLNKQDQKDFEKLTNIDASAYVSGYGKGGASVGASDERRYVCIATLDYSINVGYEGITPIKKFMEYMWNISVGGYDELAQTGNAPNTNNTAGKQYEADKNKAGQAIKNTDIDGLQVNNTITYFIIR